jgi:hypothetical protein
LGPEIENCVSAAEGDELVELKVCVWEDEREGWIKAKGIGDRKREHTQPSIVKIE